MKECAIVGVPSWIGGSISRFGFVGIVPLPLMSNWCATWLAFTRHGGLGVVGSLDSFLIVCHVLRLPYLHNSHYILDNICVHTNASLISRIAIGIKIFHTFNYNLISCLAYVIISTNCYHFIKHIQSNSG